MDRRPTGVLLAVGDELLNGDVRDLNLYRLSRGLTRLGVHVVEARLVRDAHAEIEAALRALLARAPDVLIVSGGLGPTEDDRTLSAVAEAVGLSLVENAEARRLVEARYGRLLEAGHLSQPSPEEIRRKMARLPEGAAPLPNSRGTAPGVALTYRTTRLYCLPGVPAELEALFTQEVARDLQHHLDLGAWVEAEMTVFCRDEARVAVPLRETAARHPEVYLKSLARPFPEALDGALHIIAAAHAPDATTARERVQAALHELQQQLEAAGLTAKWEKSNFSWPPPIPRGIESTLGKSPRG
ncbi:MAG: competence/damage-inducible protein A [Anaerolineae bacterium]